MNSKVSMIVPCYNKKDYIIEMLDSVTSQVYNNIELIFVDDGSADGTERIIKDYVPKLLERGFEVLIIRQKNQGLAATDRNGLMRATGDYIAFPDCDDVLHPEYASKMACYLTEHPDCEAVRCLCKNETIQDYYCDTDFFKSIMLMVIPMGAWVYLIRKTLVDRIHMIDNYYAPKGCNYQEPQITLPVAYFAENITILHEELYEYRYLPGLQGDIRTALDSSEAFCRLFLDLSAKSIKNYHIPKIYEIYAQIKYEIMWYGYRYDLGYQEQPNERIAALARELGYNIPEGSAFYNTVNIMLGIKMAASKSFCESIRGRVIFYGVLGKNYLVRSEQFKCVGVIADLMIDANAGMNTTIEKQRVISPAEYIPLRDDTIVVFPIKDEIIEEVKTVYANTEKNIRVFAVKDLIEQRFVKE
jgi:glycosyltransferase involved in cell wall biosynthesis